MKHGLNTDQRDRFEPAKSESKISFRDLSVFNPCFIRG